MSDENKIIIDDDWKAQAQREKDELSKEMDSGEGADGYEMPPVSLLTHVESLAVQAMMSLGLVEHPSAPGKRMIDPIQSKYLIDTIEMLKEKTEGNRSEEEEAYFKQLLPEIKMTYVEVMNAVSKAQAEEAANAANAADTTDDGPGGIVTP